MLSNKPLYSMVVSENTNETDNLHKTDDDVIFGTYEDTLSKLLALKKATMQSYIQAPMEPAKSQFLQDLAGHLASFVADARSNFEFQGFANDLELFDVITCFENNLIIDLSQDGNFENCSEEEETN